MGFKIGIYGGCFNPPHKMHEEIACTLIKKGYVDKVIFVPTGNKYDKIDLKDSCMRYEMLSIICKKYKKLGFNLEVSNYEIINNTKTYETLTHFKDIYSQDKPVFIMGGDNYKSFDTWKNYCGILNEYEIIVLQRNHEDLSKITEEKYCLYKDNIKLVTELGNKDISSTKIREEIKKNGIDSKIPSKYLDNEIIEYLRYKSSK